MRVVVSCGTLKVLKRRRVKNGKCQKVAGFWFTDRRYKIKRGIPRNKVKTSDFLKTE